MFTSQRLRAAAPAGQVAIREWRLDVVVSQLELTGAVTPENVAGVARRIDGALTAGVRWLIVDLSAADPVCDPMLAALVATAQVLRSRRGELIVAGAAPEVAERLAAFDVGHRPALAGTVDQAIMILKMLRPKTRIEPPGRARQKVASMTLPRIEPRPS